MEGLIWFSTRVGFRKGPPYGPLVFVSSSSMATPMVAGTGASNGRHGGVASVAASPGRKLRAALRVRVVSTVAPSASSSFTAYGTLPSPVTARWGARSQRHGGGAGAHAVQRAGGLAGGSRNRYRRRSRPEILRSWALIRHGAHGHTIQIHPVDRRQPGAQHGGQIPGERVEGRGSGALGARAHRPQAWYALRRAPGVVSSPRGATTATAA